MKRAVPRPETAHAGSNPLLSCAVCGDRHGLDWWTDRVDIAETDVVCPNCERAQAQNQNQQLQQYL